MYVENIRKYLKDFSIFVEKKRSVNLEIKSIFKSRSDDYEVEIHLKDKFNTLYIKIFVPRDRKSPAKIQTKSDENKNLDINIGNSRNVSLEHDVDMVLQVITASTKEKEAVLYVQKKLTEIFDENANQNKTVYASKTKIKKVDESIKKETLERMIERANFKNAGIYKWYKTTNSKIVLKYKNKEDENYGSEFEANTHLYYAYLLKNKYPSTRLF